ncbi:MAG: cupin domain-containing protein [Bacteroidales bacterium]|nr:cupin domain-containing protein [Bacteroidales bacterium]
MDTYLVRFAKASGIEGLFTSNHGQIFCHILSGQIRFDLNQKSYILKQGDNIYFNAKLPHNAINNNDGLSELIWIQSPPNF